MSVPRAFGRPKRLGARHSHRGFTGGFASAGPLPEPGAGGALFRKGHSPPDERWAKPLQPMLPPSLPVSPRAAPAGRVTGFWR